MGISGLGLTYWSKAVLNVVAAYEDLVSVFRFELFDAGSDTFFDGYLRTIEFLSSRRASPLSFFIRTIAGIISSSAPYWSRILLPAVLFEAFISRRL